VRRAVTGLLAIATLAHAEPVATGTDPAKRPVAPIPVEPAPAPTTVPVDEAPIASPKEASGVAREDARKDSALWIPRALLFVPRIVVWAAAQPIRGAVYAYERYSLQERFTDATFNDARTFGVYPTAAYETGFGVTVGGRLVYRDFFGHDERLKLRVNFGGRFRQAYGMNLRSGDLFGKRVFVELDSSYERRPQERFYGIGNLDDPESSRFREYLVRNVVTLDTRLYDRLHSRLSGHYMLRSFSGTGDDDSIELHYDTSQLAGFDDGVDNIYVEHELVYDSRRPTSPLQSKAIDATGWFASAFFGMTTGAGEDPSQFYRYGGELQRYFDLYDGSRVLALRAMLETVDGEEVSFIDLPRLGGSEYLRGYPNGRFRDNTIALATAEYTWDLGNYLAAYTFVDVGRPFSGPRALALEDLRVGYGGGVQVHTRFDFLMRGQIAASIDGDVFLELALSPSFGRRERAGRY
jgi:outer membrane protein assembly factor BamA